MTSARCIRRNEQTSLCLPLHANILVSASSCKHGASDGESRAGDTNTCVPAVATAHIGQDAQLCER